jgi:uncharacterized protein (DUF4415 family)
VTLRIDADVIALFRAGGAGWQTRINDALRQSVATTGGKGAKSAGKRAKRF